MCPPPSTYCSPKRCACLCALLLGVLLNPSSLMKIISSTIYHHYLSFLLSQLGHTKIVISSMFFCHTRQAFRKGLPMSWSPSAPTALPITIQFLATAIRDFALFCSLSFSLIQPLHSVGLRIILS